MVKVGFAGLSHLGLVSGICAASKGVHVVCYDSNSDLIASLRRSSLPVFEPDLDALLGKSIQQILFSDNLANLGSCEIVYISLDVKTDNQNVSDLSGLEKLILDVAKLMKSGATLVVLSQVPPGFTRRIAGLLGKVSFHLIYQVETLIFGRAVERALLPERYIIGTTDSKLPLPPNYKQFLETYGCPLLVMKYESAELAKISINLFLSASVSTTNSIAELCEKIGADWNEIVPSLKLDKRIGPHAYLAPGLGISGGNIERDLETFASIANAHGTDADVIKSYSSNSRYRKNWVLRTLQKEVLGKNPQAQIAMWGIAYKQETKSIKNSPAIALLEGLEGVSMKAYDPQAELPIGRFPNVKQMPTAVESCIGSQALVVMTPWPEFSKVDLRKVKQALGALVVIDPLGLLDQDQCAELGFTYFKLGQKGSN